MRRICFYKYFLYYHFITPKEEIKLETNKGKEERRIFAVIVEGKLEEEVEAQQTLKRSF